MKKVHETEEVYCDQCPFLFFFLFLGKFHHVATKKKFKKKKKKKLGEWL